MKWKLFVGFWLLLLTAVVPSSILAYSLDASAEAALIKGDWNQVIEVLAKGGPTTADPVVRLLLGNGYLATNRNNAAMLLFLSVQGRSDLSLWAQWTASFFKSHQKSTVAQYLAADALTRVGSLQKGIEGFTMVINSRNSSVLDRTLSLNARGVAYVLANNLSAAQVDFYLATKQSPNLADAYANLGTLSVFQEVSIRQGKGALEAFNRALTINPHFALAYNGRGCLYFGNGDFELAAKDFEKAATLIPNLGFIETNLDFVSAFASQLPTLVRLTSKPGMNIAMGVEQQQTSLRRQQQEMRDCPDESTILALPHMSPKNKQAVVNKYGWVNVEKATKLTLQRGQTKMIANNQQMTKLQGQRKIIHKLEAALVAIKGIKFARSMVTNIAKMPTHGGKSLQTSAEKSIMSASTDSHSLKVIIDAIEPNPMVSTMNSVQNIGESVLKDQSSAVNNTQIKVFDETRHLGLQMRNLNHFLNSYPSSVRIVQNPIAHQMPPRQPRKVPDIQRKSTVISPMAIQPIKPVTPSIPKFTPPPSIKFRTPQISRFPQPPGGVDTEITAYIDKGNWPVLTVFGLIYQVKSVEKPK